MPYEVEHFERDVVEVSAREPVLVDFWAPWCGPCRVIGPVLEKLAQEPDAGFSLVKVNTDVHQDLAARYQIRGIPAVKLFVGGRVVDEFTGALPEYAVRQWLQKALPSESRGLVEEAESLLDEGRFERAAHLLDRVLSTDPMNPAASALLARAVVFAEPERALTIIEPGMTAEPRFVQMVESVRTLANLLLRPFDDLPDGPGRDSFLDGVTALRERRFDDAIRGFIDVLRTNRYYDDDAARRAGVALFTLLGDGHPVTQTHRRTFNMWLY